MKGTRRAGLGGIVAAAVLALAAGCGDGGGGADVVDAGDASGSDTGGNSSLVWANPVAEAPAGSTVAVVLQALDAGGNGVPDATLQARVTRGGGTLAATTAVTGVDGRATLQWTLGVAPVGQDLEVVWDWAEGGPARPHLDATRAEPLAVAPFGDVDGFLSTASIEGSTEDLALSPDGQHLVLGVPGALVTLDATGNAATMALKGDDMGWVLGLAYDDDGHLWGADANGKALLRVDADGTVAKVVSEGFGYPNDLAVLPGGFVAVADTCLGKVVVFRPDGTKVSEGVFDTKTEGGANGLAVDPSGAALWVTTENAALLCGDGSDPASANGGLYRFALASDGTLSDRTTVKAGLAHYADGITFDADGNLYAMVDRMNTEDYTLAESAVEVLPAGGSALRPFLRATDRALANAVFGSAAFGKGTMYLALVAIPLLVDPSMRGVAKFDVGIGK